MKKKLVVLGMLFGLTFCMQPVFAAEADRCISLRCRSRAGRSLQCDSHF